GGDDVNGLNVVLVGHGARHLDGERHHVAVVRGLRQLEGELAVAGRLSVADDLLDGLLPALGRLLRGHRTGKQGRKRGRGGRSKKENAPIKHRAVRWRKHGENEYGT